MNRYQIAFTLSAPDGEKPGIYTGSANTLNEFFCDFGIHLLKLNATGCGFKNDGVRIIERDGQKVSIQADAAEIKDSKFFVNMALLIGTSKNAQMKKELLADLREFAGRDKDQQDRWVEEMNIKMNLIENPRSKVFLKNLLDRLSTD